MGVTSYNLRDLENKVLRQMSVPKKGVVSGVIFTSDSTLYKTFG